jgi:hypothetical protein
MGTSGNSLVGFNMTIEGNESVSSVRVPFSCLLLTVENTVGDQTTRIIRPAILRCDGLAISIVYVLTNRYEQVSSAVKLNGRTHADLASPLS